MKRVPMLDDIQGQASSLRRVLDLHMESRQAVLAECGRLIREAQGRIIVTGMGASFFAALPAVQALEAQGRRVCYTESAELLHFGASSMQKDDIALLISRSGGSIEVLRLAEKMQRSGTRVIGITNIAESKLAQVADVTLVIGSAPDQLIAVQTYTATVLALLLLAEQVRCSSVASLAEQCATVLPLLKGFIDETLHESDRWEEFLQTSMPLYLLGRGSSLAAVSEGSLLFHETAKAATVGMSSGQFRHGPVEVVTKDFRAIVIGTPQATRHLDWSLASDLRSMGTSVCWIGPVPNDGGKGILLMQPWPPEIPEPLMPLFDIVPLQVAAYRLAQWRGITPGNFRYAPEITQKESGFPLQDASLA